MIPRVAAEKLATFCDVFVETGAFSPNEAYTIIASAKRYGLRPKLHADQLADGGGAALAAEVGAISADHLEYASDDGLKAMAAAGVVAVALPIASLYLRQPPLDARRCLAAGVTVAVATDFNPGSAPCYDLPLAMTLACTMNRLTPAEALRGATINAAKAIGVENEVGSLEPGKRADFALIDAESVEQWLYHYRPDSVRATYIGGEQEFSPLPALRERGRG
jgi:imidazolonepropionase